MWNGSVIASSRLIEASTSRRSRMKDTAALSERIDASPWSDVGALIELERLRFMNAVRITVRNPQRLLAWFIFLLVLVSGRLLSAPASRIANVVVGPSTTIGQSPHVAPVILPGLVLAALSMLVFQGTVTPPALFRSSAEARQLMCSRVEPATVVAWLQIRRLLASRVWIILTFIGLVFRLATSHRVEPAITLTLSIIGVVLFIMAAPWLAYFATWRWPWLPVRWAAAAGVATGLASFIVPYLTWAKESLGAELPMPSLP